RAIRLDLHSVVGKPLDHPLLKGLSIQPSLATEGGETKLTLRIAGGAPARTLKWRLEHPSRALVPQGEGVMGGAGMDTEVFRRYAGPLPEGCTLRLVVAVAVETRLFRFDFSDVELP